MLRLPRSKGLLGLIGLIIYLNQDKSGYRKDTTRRKNYDQGDEPKLRIVGETSHSSLFTTITIIYLFNSLHLYISTTPLFTLVGDYNA